MAKVLRLGLPKVAAIIDQRYAQEGDGWRKRRLLAIKLAAKGEYGAEEVAELCGISRSRVFVWLKCVRKDGLEALLEREKPGPKEGTYRGVEPEVMAGLAGRLKAGEFASAQQARRWLKKEHGVERCYGSVWQWLKKIERSAAGAAAQSLQEKPRSGGGVQKRPVRKAPGACNQDWEPGEGVVHG